MRGWLTNFLAALGVVLFLGLGAAAIHHDSNNHRYCLKRPWLDTKNGC
jgi:hypothetical protein